MSVPIYCLIVLVIAIVGVLLYIDYRRFYSERPEVKSHDAIAEEIRRERIELHNTSLAYADLQGEKDARAVMMLAAAFRSGAKWQQRQP